MLVIIALYDPAPIPLHLPCRDPLTKLLAWHSSVRTGDPSCPHSLLAPPLLLSQGLLTTEADALHRRQLCFHATDVLVESKLFGQGASGWHRRPQGWVCRSDLTVTQQPFVPAHSLPAGAGPNSGSSLAERAHADFSLGGPGRPSRAGIF